MDKLYIDNNRDVFIGNWVDENKGVLIEGGLLNKNTPLPFNKIALILLFSNENIELKIEGETLDKILITMLNSTGKKMFTCTVYEFITASDPKLGIDFGYQIGINFLQKFIANDNELNDVFEESIRQTTRMVYEIMIYIMFHKEDVQFEKAVKKHDIHKPKKSNKQKKRKIYLERHYKLVGMDNSNRVNSSKKRKYSTESWSVRGHVRRCKNGKVIFVKPYIKGKGNQVSKEYKL